MDHIFEQKLVNEQIALRNTLAQQTKKVNELMEQIHAYDLMLEDFAVSYLENGGSPEELEELFNMAGLKEKGKAILSKVGEMGRTAGKVIGRHALAASLVVSPGAYLNKTTIPGKAGTPAQAAVIEKGTPGTPAVAATGKFEITGQKHPKTGEFMRKDGKLLHGPDSGYISDAGEALAHSVPGSVTHTAAQKAIASARPAVPGTPDRIVKPAVPAVPGTPAKTNTSASLTVVPNTKKYLPAQGLPRVTEIKKRKPQTGPIDVTATDATTTPSPRTDGGSNSSNGGSRRSGTTPRPYPPTPVTPEPVLGKFGLGTTSPNIQRGSTEPRIISGSAANRTLRDKVAAAEGQRRAARTDGISTPVVGTQGGYRVASSIRPRVTRPARVTLEESIEQTIRNTLNEG
jgi:hypothetical protein